MTETYCKMS